MDISKCLGAFCKKRDKCLRHVSKINLYYQSWINPKKIEDCEYFVKIKEEKKK